MTVTNYDPTMSYYSAARPRNSVKNAAGAVVGGALLGMGAYYIPVSKNEFVESAFDVHRNNVNRQICALKNAAVEVEKGQVSTPSKMLLQAHSLPEDVVQISNKCIDLDKSICDETAVKSYKNTLEQGFESIKKQAGSRSNEATEALRTIKRGRFWWGLGIGAAAGLALSLLCNRD